MANVTELQLLAQLGVGSLAPTKLRNSYPAFWVQDLKEDNLPPMKKGEMGNPNNSYKRVDGDIYRSPHKFENRKVRWYHVSPYKLKPGDILKPGIKEKNFASYSGERVYISSSPYTHWTLAGSDAAKFLYEVRPLSKPQPGQFEDHHCKEAVVLRSMGKAMNKMAGSDTRLYRPRKKHAEEA